MWSKINEPAAVAVVAAAVVGVGVVVVVVVVVVAVYCQKSLKKECQNKTGFAPTISNDAS